MRTYGPEQTRAALAWEPLLQALREMFHDGCEMPQRHHHTVPVPGAPDATLLLMPAWSVGQFLGVKVLNVFPGNAERGLASIAASYMLMSGTSGEMLALIDGGELTARRTAAASALASSYLSRADSVHLLIVGTGRLAGNLASAHAAVRPLRRISVWGRHVEKAKDLADSLHVGDAEIHVVTDLAAAVGKADIVSCATLAHQPLIHGSWLQPGTHLDLVGGFTPEMREADDEAVRRSSVFVDTFTGACSEAGDIVQPLESGVLEHTAIEADLFGLVRGQHAGRESDQEITFFKSVGAALEDLAAAVLVHRSGN